MRYSVLLGLVFAFLVAGCGFQLRGLNTQLTEKFQKTYLAEEKNAFDSDFYLSVRQLLVTNGGGLSEKAEATVTVLLSPISINSRQIALSNDGLLKEYERTYKATVTVLDSQNDIQLGSRVVSTIKNIQLSDDLVLAGEEQIKITNKEAHRALAQSVMLYLESF